MDNQNQARMSVAQMLDCDWTDEALVKRLLKVPFQHPHYNTITIAELMRVSDPKVYLKAHELWLKLKEAFNDEAPFYAKYGSSVLGSIGSVDRREVLRGNWWGVLDGNKYGNYRDLTCIIEYLHCGEQLETGVIIFGS